MAKFMFSFSQVVVTEGKRLRHQTAPSKSTPGAGPVWATILTFNRAALAPLIITVLPPHINALTTVFWMNVSLAQYQHQSAPREGIGCV